MSKTRNGKPPIRFPPGLDGLNTLSPKSDIAAEIGRIEKIQKENGLHPLDEGYLNLLRGYHDVATEAGGFIPAPIARRKLH